MRKPVRGRVGASKKRNELKKKRTANAEKVRRRDQVGLL